jgi:hypothetical protein
MTHLTCGWRVRDISDLTLHGVSITHIGTSHARDF